MRHRETKSSFPQDPTASPASQLKCQESNPAVLSLCSGRRTWPLSQTDSQSEKACGTICVIPIGKMAGGGAGDRSCCLCCRKRLMQGEPLCWQWVRTQRGKGQGPRDQRTSGRTSRPLSGPVRSWALWSSRLLGPSLSLAFGAHPSWVIRGFVQLGPGDR